MTINNIELTCKAEGPSPSLSPAASVAGERKQQ